MVYRKKTDKLIDWFIRNHPDRDIIENSKVADGYEKTNIWKIHPKTNSKHPAAFPKELAQKVISYYSFKNDVVFDPFAGSGTVGAAAADLKRRFVLFELNPNYIKLIREELRIWPNIAPNSVMYINCDPVERQTELFL